MISIIEKEYVILWTLPHRIIYASETEYNKVTHIRMEQSVPPLPVVVKPKRGRRPKKPVGPSATITRTPVVVTFD